MIINNLSYLLEWQEILLDINNLQMLNFLMYILVIVIIFLFSHSYCYTIFICSIKFNAKCTRLS